MGKTLTDHWDDVEDALGETHLIAWDTCHKIYLALDEHEADWFRKHGGYELVTGTPDELLATLHRWYDASCPLRFINSVVHVESDPNSGYTALIPQGATDEDEDDWDHDEDEDDWDDDEDDQDGGR